jgi:D-lyxose ketol-isomerase
MRTLAFHLAFTVAALAACADEKPSIKFDNAYFYDAGGKFLPEKAKDACIALMKYHGYPVFKDIRDKLWVSDYGRGQYARLGLAAVVFVNNEKDRYMLLDIYLLPNQMLPEHWHLSTDKNPAKMEGWLVRHGSARFVGEGEPNLSKEVVIPAIHMNGTATVRHETLCGPGDWTQVQRVGAPHWIYAGIEGVIVTEVANVHDSAGVRHADKALNEFFLKEYGGAK